MRLNKKIYQNFFVKNAIYQAIRNNIVAKQITELILLFHESITKLVFFWPNMDPKIFKFKYYKNMVTECWDLTPNRVQMYHLYILIKLILYVIYRNGILMK